MKNLVYTPRFLLSISWGILLSFITPLAAFSQQPQPITPAENGTGTVVNPEGEVFHIQGGTLSSDGQNLFHKFEQFGLDAGQTANFLSNPEIRNILGRVTGRNASYINGLIQVTGGQSNLFLINPAGLVFGPDAALNVPAAFTATTATGIEFESGWFDGEGFNNYTQLIGKPLAFSFSTQDLGSIINTAHLSVNPDQNLNLIGGTVLNTGTLRAPGGTITLAAVPGESLVRIAQEGYLLSIEVNPQDLTPDNSGSLPLSVNPLSLPELLTQTGVGHATGVTVTEAGTVILTGSGLPVERGDLVMSDRPLSSTVPEDRTLINSANAILSAHETLTIVGGQLRTTGDLTLQGGDTVRVREGETGFQAIAGGNLTILGDQSIDILALTGIQPAFQAGGNLRLVSPGNISGDSNFSAGGNFSIENAVGGGGQFLSLYDPIISASGDVILGSYTGVSLKIEAGGAIIADDITITGPDTTLGNLNDPDAELLLNAATLILRSGVESAVNPSDISTTLGNTFIITRPQSSPANITLGRVSTAGGPVILNSAGELFFDAIATAGGEIRLTANDNITATGTLNSQGGDINIIAGNFLRVLDTFNNQNGVNASISSAESGDSGGDIRIEHSGGTTTPFIIGDATVNGTAGAITTGSTTISPNFSVPVPPSEYIQGNITIVTQSPNGTPTDPGEETPTDPGEETPTDPGDGTPNQPGEETPTDPGDGTPNQPGEETPTDPGDGTPNQPGEETPTDPGDGTPNQPGDGTPNQPGEETPSEPGDGTPNQPGDGTPNQPGDGTPNQPGEETPSEPGDGTPNQPGDGTPNQPGDGTPNQPGDGTPNQPGDGTPNQPDPTSPPSDGTPSEPGDGTPSEPGDGTPSEPGDGTPNQPDPTSPPIGSDNPSTGPIVTPPIQPNPVPPPLIISPEPDESNPPGGNISNPVPPGNNGGENFPIAPIIPTPPIIPSTPNGESRSEEIVRNLRSLQLEVAPNLGETEMGNTLVSPIPNVNERGYGGSYLSETSQISAWDQAQNSPSIRTVNRVDIEQQLDQGNVPEAISLLDMYFTEELGVYLGQNVRRNLKTFSALQEKIEHDSEPTGTNPAIIYAFAREQGLDLILMPSHGNPIYKKVEEADRETLLKVVMDFRKAIADPRSRTTKSYQVPAKQLYEWFIETLAEDLVELEIDTLMFSMDEGLRSLPVAALYDGEQFLIEQYTIGLVPSVNLTEMNYKPLNNAQLLAMGVSEFSEMYPLPAVTVEIDSILTEWPGQAFLNEKLTLNNLQAQRQKESFQMIHLATHADFKSGSPSNSFIQLWDTTLPLSELRRLNWTEPPVELLVLSACRTAIGDRYAELGFAGLAVQAGVKSALASIWYISDEGTVALMNEFYNQFRSGWINEDGTPSSTRPYTKAEALRRAQVAMIQGDWRIENGEWVANNPSRRISLPPELKNLANQNLNHPYYWAAFVMIGSPW
ncbi:CHAT domain-containing protein [Oscillatoria acuminata]|uniref:Filamentous hemagglutinin family N-terminal domain protein n=1 Tax=Oscillatoria acuminata PCC 6304 TaxID=56110 RepID=K9TC03_9CYAN|nr:CHAT domain-containing protein [Oscillatoria acuminata]AFY80402.1 filamentous hemagglutinin family N-terminal domain protein [Oscillatoria acuminata PCC 6304]